MCLDQSLGLCATSRQGMHDVQSRSLACAAVMLEPASVGCSGLMTGSFTGRALMRTVTPGLQLRARYELAASP